MTGDGDEALADGFVEAGGDFSAGLKREKSAAMVLAVIGFGGARHTAVTGIGVGKGTARRNVAGSLLGHGKSPEN